MRSVVMLLLLASVAAGCARVGRMAEGVGDAVSFRSKVDVDASGPEKRRLRISVPADTGNAAEIREAAVSAANDYCINRFGSSEKVWAVDEETGDWAFVVAGDRVIFLTDCTG